MQQHATIKSKNGSQSFRFLVYAVTALGIGFNLLELTKPGLETNGFTTLPMAVFLILALLPSVCRDMPVFENHIWPQWMMRHRRDLGICAGLWVMTHGLTKALLTLAIQPEGALHHLLRADILLGLSAGLIMLALLITSNDAAMRMLRQRWKTLHRLVWLAIGLGMIHGLYASRAYGNDGELGPPIFAMAVLSAAPFLGWLLGARKTRHRMIYAGAGLAIGLALLTLVGPLPLPSITVD